MHSQAVLRDAEDRTRQLRWQQHQLTSFMAEVKELIRPETPLEAREVEEEAVDAAPLDFESSEPSDVVEAAIPGESAEAEAEAGAAQVEEDSEQNAA